MKSNTFSLRSYAAMGVLAGVFAVPAVSGHELFGSELRPYVGVGAQGMDLKFQKLYGQPLFNGSVLGGAVFGGVRIGEFAGLELGYNQFSRKRDKQINGADPYPDGSGERLLDVGFTFMTFNTRVQIKDINLGLTGYLPLGRLNCALDKTEFFGTLGVSNTSIKLQTQQLSNSDPAIPGPFRVDTFKKRKNIPLVRLGLQQNLTDNVNLSVFSEWKRYKSFKLISTTSTLQFRPKNTISYGVRLGYAF